MYTNPTGVRFRQHRHKRGRLGLNRQFWHSPTGRVTGGVSVLAAVAAAMLSAYGTDGATSATPAKLSVAAHDRLASVGGAGAQTAPASVALRRPKAAPAPKSFETLSLDPGARIPEQQAWLKNGVVAAPVDGRPMIAVVIDDVGLDRPRSRRAMALPAPVTIALMAYADDARDQAALARRGGHELLVHVPMEPGDSSENPGPNALAGNLPQAEFTRRLEWNLSQFGGYVGINNHMGSRLTSNPAALAPVMAALKRRGLLFLDSRTTAETRGLDIARHFGVPAVERNVFLDHDVSAAAVDAALLRTEELARRNGFAIAIGHPKDITLSALEAWLPDVRARGFAVVPLTAVVRQFASAGLRDLAAR